MNKLDEIREQIRCFDEQILTLLENRFAETKKLVELKKASKAVILDPAEDKRQEEEWKKKLSGNCFEDEIGHILRTVLKNDRKVQAKSLFDYNIFLIGFMGAGKSTVASALERQLEMERIEMDAAIARKQKMTIPEIFAEFGEDYFRDLESDMLLELQKRSQMLVSCGGGVVMRPGNAELMKQHGRVILLTASPETVFERVKDSRERPILNDNMSVEFISQLMEKRREKYQAAADVIVETDGKHVIDICEEMIQKLIELDRMSK